MQNLWTDKKLKITMMIQLVVYILPDFLAEILLWCFMGVEINSKDVSELVVEMCGKLFSKTTAAQVPVVGGNERVI